MEKKLSISEFLATVKVTEICKNQKVISVSSNDTLEQGFTKLASNNILSAPVYDEKSKKYTGFLDMRDLVSSVVFIAQHSGSNWTKTKTLKDLLVNAKWVGGTYTVTYLSRRNAFQPVKQDANLLDVVKLLETKGPKLVKRVPVINDEGHPIAIISQSTIIQLIQKNIEKIKDPKLHKKISELDLGSKPCIAVKDSTPAIEVFKIMDTYAFSGIALVDESGKLVGNLSSRDLKAFIKSIDFSLLVTPIGNFVKHIRQTAIDIRSPTISGFETNTFKFIIEKLAATRVHRIYIVNNEEKFTPIRVVSLLDVLRELL